MKDKITLNETIKESIAIALIRLMNKKSIHRISISELTSLAGVCRTSFYRNFDTKEDVICFYMNYLYENFFNSLDHSLYNDLDIDLQNFYIPRFSFVKKNRDFFVALSKSNLLDFAFDQLETSLFLCMNGLNDDVNPYTISLVKGSCVGVLRQWIKDDFKENEAKLAQIILTNFYTEKAN